MPYSDYRRSVWWNDRRLRYRTRVADGYHGYLYCEACSWPERWLEDGAELSMRFHVHHLTYERIGCELDDDLLLVCSPCHNAIHFPNSAAAKFWTSRPVHVRNNLAARLASLRPETAAATHWKARLNGWAKRRYGEAWDDDPAVRDEITERFEQWSEERE
jgi:hypothetical protein